MFRLSAKVLISSGLVAFLLGLLMLAVEIGIVRNPMDARLKSRASLCETLGLSTSILASRGDTAAIDSFLRVIKERNPDIRSLGIRKFGKYLVSATDRHQALWDEPTEFQEETRIEVPVLTRAGREWGTVEVVFDPISLSGLNGFLNSHVTQLLSFVGLFSFVAFYIYLGKILKVVNAKSVPQRVRTALNALAGGLVVADANGDIVLANDALASWVGKDPDSLVGKMIDELPWRHGAAGAPWQSTFDSQALVVGGTTRLAAVDGGRTLIVNSSPLVTAEGELRGAFIGLEDVTVLEQKEVEHKKLREEAERANSAKSDFLARMSHEIRTPMNAILGFTDVLRRGFDRDSQEREEYLDTIHSSGEHLLSLINDILDLSKVEAGQIELERTRYSPHKVVLETLQVLKVQADEKDLSLAYQPKDGLPETITGDSVRMRQILTNLVGNAIKFTESGGVRIAARLFEGALEFSIIDTGIGIKEEALGRIFEPFSQADSSVTRKFGGTGLGLAIVKRFVEAMGGSIEVTSKEGEGTTFVIRIDPGPLEGIPRISRSEALRACRTVGDKTMEVALPPCRVLIVDDGDSNRKLLRLFLQRAGADVDEAANGKEAVDQAIMHDYDVILMDMQMPVMDGYTAAANLRSRGQTTPIVALTAHAMKEDETKCHDAGCSHFLPKPVDSNRLLRLMGEIVGGDVHVAGTSKAGVQMSKRTPIGSAVKESDAPDLAPITSDLPMDDHEFREIVIEFVDRLEEQLREMEIACEAAEYDQLARLAHWLKGSAGTAGFGEFTEPARQLEQLAKAEVGNEAHGAILGLRKMRQRIVVPSATCS